MKADMEAMKEQMTIMMEAIISMRKMMEVNTATVIAASSPSQHMACLPTMHHPMLHMLPMRISITLLPYSLRANNPNLIMHMSLNP